MDIVKNLIKLIAVTAAFSIGISNLMLIADGSSSL